MQLNLGYKRRSNHISVRRQQFIEIIRKIEHFSISYEEVQRKAIDMKLERKNGEDR